MKRSTLAVARWVLAVVVLILLILSERAQSPEVVAVSPLPSITAAPSSEPFILSSTTATLAASGAAVLQRATLQRIVDGDTVGVILNGRSETIRIIGINTPETVAPRQKVGCFGPEASAQARQYLGQNGSPLWLTADPSQGERDKYQRLLRYVFFVQNGVLVDYGHQMIAQGYAQEYTYSKPYLYQQLYRQAATGARAAKLGMWADNVCPTIMSPAPN